MPSLIQAVLDLAVEIQQIPAPTFEEARRAAFLSRRFQEEGLHVEQDEVGNVYACLAGTGDARPVVVSAHSDTVFPADTDLSVRRTAGKIHAPGIGDNSVAVAGLFGLLWSLREAAYTPPGDLWLVANVCEEGLGDLKGMRAVVRRFGAAPVAYVVLEGVALGTIFHRGLGVRRYRVHVHTAGGHSWGDFGKPSAIHELAEIVHHMTALPLPTQPCASLNVGVIQGGTSVNTIAAHAWMELDVRAEEAYTLQMVVKDVERVLADAARPGVDVRAEVIGRRPAGEIDPAHPLVRLAKEALYAQGISPALSIGSTDANIPISQGLPAVCVGLTRGGGVHTTREFIETEPLAKGLAALTALVQGAFHLRSEG